jgi:transposase
VQEVYEARIQALEAQVAELLAINKGLMARVAELEAKLAQSSRNSGKPPSSDSPAQREARPGKPGSGRKRGGQPGHEGHERTLVPAERVDRRVTCDPRRCRRCSEDLSTAEILAPLLHQIAEIPELRAFVTEFVLGRRRCGRCSTVTCGRPPRGVGRGMCGPRLMALIALLTGVRHLSRRSALDLLHDVLGIDISLGCLSEVEGKVSTALAAAHQEALDCARTATTKNLDATTWARSGQYRALWVLACTAATVFSISADATTAAVRKLVRFTRGVLMSDRGSQFGFWAMDKRQICWAHLMRKFVAFTESNNPKVKALGENLLVLAKIHLGAWHDARDGTCGRATLQRIVRNLEPYLVAHLEHGVALGVRGVAGACANILEHRDALFTYAFVDGVEPTNNHAEREIRTFVLWRKRSFGSQSERGDRYAERVMTVVHTLRKHDRNVFSYLVDACRTFLGGTSTPALLPARA